METVRAADFAPATYVHGVGVPRAVSSKTAAGGIRSHGCDIIRMNRSFITLEQTYSQTGKLPLRVSFLSTPP
jgi:hypothetical protein